MYSEWIYIAVETFIIHHGPKYRWNPWLHSSSLITSCVLLISCVQPQGSWSSACSSWRCSNQCWTAWRWAGYYICKLVSPKMWAFCMCITPGMPTFVGNERNLVPDTLESATFGKVLQRWIRVDWGTRLNWCWQTFVMKWNNAVDQPIQRCQPGRWIHWHWVALPVLS